MKTIAATVAEYIKTKPYLSSALSEGIINLTSLARTIQKDIEERTKKPVKSGAIVMALKRISDTADFIQTKKIIKVLKNLGDITVRSSLVDYSFLISETLLSAQSNLLKTIQEQKEVFSVWYNYLMGAISYNDAHDWPQRYNFNLDETSKYFNASSCSSSYYQSWRCNCSLFLQIASCSGVYL